MRDAKLFGGVYSIDSWKHDASWKKSAKVFFSAGELYRLQMRRFDKLILRKITKTVATRCHILKRK